MCFCSTSKCAGRSYGRGETGGHTCREHTGQSAVTQESRTSRNLARAWSRTLVRVGSMPSVCAVHAVLLGGESPLSRYVWSRRTSEAPGRHRKGGLMEAWNEGAGRGTRTGYKVWDARVEGARDHKVLHPQLGRT